MLANLLVWIMAILSSISIYSASVNIEYTHVAKKNMMLSFLANALVYRQNNAIDLCGRSSCAQFKQEDEIIPEEIKRSDIQKKIETCFIESDGAKYVMSKFLSHDNEYTQYIESPEFLIFLEENRSFFDSPFEIQKGRGAFFSALADECFNQSILIDELFLVSEIKP
ncbi:hypothetical protein JZL99_24910 [Escherichia coli]|uniref:hypothetical protein n=1 Tax=Escherichia coli TaxID=562 RepID=UPI0019CF568D|nr:hypothetical protein [Escherichia coli]MBN6417289.1 hypothetical protein [Escherichia coli]